MEGSSEFMKKDGTYSWLVLVIILANCYCCMGYTFSSAALYSAIYPDLLGIDQLKAHTISSVLVGVFLCSIPLSTLVLPVIGCRALAGMSVLLTLTSVISSAFATQFWHLILGFSIIGGLGMSMNSIASIGIIPHYFDKRKSAAYAAPGLGTGLAIVTFPYIVSSLQKSFGYRYGVLYLSPLFLITVTSALVYKPQLTPTRPASASILLRAYVTPFKRLVTPFYFLNAFFMFGGHVSLIIILFSHVAALSQPAVAVLSVSLVGVGRVVGSVLLLVFLLKFKCNHYVLQIFSNTLMGVSCLLLAFIHHKYAYYLLSTSIGIAWGATMSNMPCLASFIYPAKQVEYAFGFQHFIGGVSALISPVATGVVLDKYGDKVGLCFISAHGFSAAFSLVFVALLRPRIWSRYQTTLQSLPETSDDKESGQQVSKDIPESLSTTGSPI